MLAILLTGCDSVQRNNDVCWSSFIPRVSHLVPVGYEQTRENVSGCMAHWAARLSLSEETPADVVQAATFACEGAFDDMRAAPGPMGDPDGDIEKMRRDAYFIVVRQRAGNCGIPELGPIPK